MLPTTVTGSLIAIAERAESVVPDSGTASKRSTANATGADFVPFAVGYVELQDEVKVETRLTEMDPSRLRIGMEMELALVPLNKDNDGNDVVTFAFTPVA